MVLMMNESISDKIITVIQSLLLYVWNWLVSWNGPKIKELQLVRRLFMQKGDRLWILTPNLKYKKDIDDVISYITELFRTENPGDVFDVIERLRPELKANDVSRPLIVTLNIMAEFRDRIDDKILEELNNFRLIPEVAKWFRYDIVREVPDKYFDGLYDNPNAPTISNALISDDSRKVIDPLI